MARSANLLHSLILLIALAPLSGCSTLKGGKLMAPEAFGWVPAGANLYVERGSDAATQRSLALAMSQAEAVIEASFGSVASRPVVHACLSEQCLADFGGQGDIAKVYGDRILLSARGANWQFIAHEWSHAEMFKRLSWRAWWRLPKWFDEGLAVALSQAPEHSEAHWQYLVSAGIARPSTTELLTLQTRHQWLEAHRLYSDNQNAERRARGEAEVHALYAAAGHQVRPWLAEAGRAGLLRLIERLNAGETFELSGAGPALR
ncbi:hypothetical protein LNV09_21830 [Paucibacter sp. B2R-40]|uniref:hypothetical protein n=1 Tax=Paucibacter sp. B2R-40 TaxID=2893554 RepID=UPI0021E50D08|nr:hypothetical protein [Paucibacter sp. B2R-40]MCV2356789.1 hypothetical protein [Paucibacter sp. B2R-40]